MFRAILLSSSGGQIVLIQHLVSSLSVSGCSVRRLRESSLLTCALNSHSHMQTSSNSSMTTTGSSKAWQVPDAVYTVLNS
jgi:hypothetical protein